MFDLLSCQRPLLGISVSLLPLSVEFRDELVNASNDGDLSTLWFTGVPNEQSIDNYLSLATKQRDQGVAIPYIVKDNLTGKIIGSTRLCNADVENQRIEIGYTWYAKSYQRSAVNTECKLLLLTYAFEQLEAIAVEFRTHWHNHVSRNAIARLGAKQDGVLRNHKIHANGEYRDTVVFSILNSEWPMVKKSLLHKQSHYQ